MLEITTYTINFQIPEDLTIYGFTGKIAHASVLALINQSSPELSAKLHEGTDRRPFVVSAIKQPKEFNRTIGKFNITTTDPIVKQALQHVFHSSVAVTINILDHQCTVTNISVQSEFLPNTEPIQIGTGIRLRFLSPTLFSNSKRNSTTDAYPSLERMWKSMIDTWNFLAGDQLEKINEDFYQRLLNQINVPSFDLKSTHLRLSQKIKVTGFTGMMNLYIENAEGLEQLLPMLKLAGKWGVGSKRTFGFGRTTVQIRYPKGKENNGNISI